MLQCARAGLDVRVKRISFGQVEAYDVTIHGAACLLKCLFVSGAQSEDVVGGVEVFEAVVLGRGVDNEGAAAEDTKLSGSLEGEKVGDRAGLKGEICQWTAVRLLMR